MRLLLKGYYGYKNFGDELLLLGVLGYCVQHIPDISHIIIEAQDTSWLNFRLKKHTQTLNNMGVSQSMKIDCVRRIPYFPPKEAILIIGGGEALSDARKIPYNGWTTFVYCFRYYVFARVWVVGGVGTVTRMGTRFLYYMMLGGAERVVCRERWSCEVAENFSQHVELYHDFAYEVLEAQTERAKELRPNKTPPENYVIVNINIHRFGDKERSKLKELYEKYKNSHKIYFFPASVGQDDADVLLLDDLKKYIPNVILYDRTHQTVGEVCDFVCCASYGLLARLHLVLLFDFFDVPFDPIVYQEKVQKLIDTRS